MKQQAIMASKASPPKSRIPTLAEFGADIARRRAELSIPELPRNAGKNRTPSKIALLKAIEDAGGKW